MKKYTEPKIEVIDLVTEGRGIMNVSTVVVDPDKGVDAGEISRRRGDSWSER
jgi:hypothetical protein